MRLIYIEQIKGGQKMNYFCFNWELELLQAIQGLHASWLSPIMVFVSWINSHGEMWIALGIVLACIPKTRKCGCTMLVAMALGALTADVILKPLIQRARPFQYITQDGSLQDLFQQAQITYQGMVFEIDMVLKENSLPKDFSFPSGHSVCGFAASVSMFAYYKKAGFAAICLAAVIAFSRLYLFVHFPTDVIVGICIGTIYAILAYFIVKPIWKKLGEKKPEKIEAKEE